MKKFIAYILTAAVVGALGLPALPAADAADEGQVYRDRQEDIMAAAALLRELGVGEDSDAILALREEYWRCEARLHPCFTEEEVVMLAKTMYGEARGVESVTEVACIGWTACNRADDPRFPDTVAKVLTQPGQMYYRSYFPVREDLLELARDVLERWTMEKLGYTGAGRVLAEGFCWYAGDGKHNWFRDEYRGGRRWGYELPSPYES